MPKDTPMSAYVTDFCCEIMFVVSKSHDILFPFQALLAGKESSHQCVWTKIGFVGWKKGQATRGVLSLATWFRSSTWPEAERFSLASRKEYDFKKGMSQYCFPKKTALFPKLQPKKQQQGFINQVSLIFETHPKQDINSSSGGFGIGP